MTSPSRGSVLTDAHRCPAGEVLRRLGVAREQGLAPGEVRERRHRYGRNLLRVTPPKSAWRVLRAQLESLVVGLLAAAAALALVFSQVTEAVAIGAVILLNTAIGFVTELRAVRSVEALRRMARVTTRVRRHGEVREVPAQDLVPGDVVLLEAGDVITADLRLLEASRLECDESLLTGESIPVRKSVAPVAGDAPVAERASIGFKGTAVTRGAGEGVVVATGMATELGRISRLVDEAAEESSPLERRLDRLGSQLVVWVLGLAVLIAGAGVAAGRDLLLMLQTGIALAVAAVPEGLPIVATVALARGVWRMARRQALIRDLGAVETLGATTVILTDKTGTLTENRMAVARLWLASGAVAVERGAGARRPAFRREDSREAVDATRDPLLRAALEVGVLCSNASLAGPGRDADLAGPVGDPLEVALLEVGAGAGLERGALLERMPRVREQAFDSEIKMMATVHRLDGRHVVAVKGAPEAVLSHVVSIEGIDDTASLSDAQRQTWLERSGELARQGLRVLALARKTVTDPEADPYRDLRLVGLAGLLDPPRGDVAPAIRACREAHVGVVMVTGDHAMTARAIASAVGLAADATVVEGRELPGAGPVSLETRERLLQTRVFARVSPEQKLGLVSLYQAAGAVVAMTGDGVNDAPALRRADVGIAMGRRGTQVAREAADVVLRDDAFSSIVAAIEQGRVILGNTRQFVVYLLSCNLSEILTVGGAFLSGLPLPITPLQILYLNLVTDVFPAFALGVGEGPAGIMKAPPRDPRAPAVGRSDWLAIAGYGALIMGATLSAFTVARGGLGLDDAGATNLAFLTLAFAQLWHVFNMRAAGSSLLVNDVTRNPFVWGALALCVGLVLAAVHVPPVASVLELGPPGPTGWLLVALCSLAPWAIGQALRSWPARPPTDGRAAPGG